MAEGVGAWFYGAFAAILRGDLSFLGSADVARPVYRIAMVHSWTPDDSALVWGDVVAKEVSGQGYTADGAAIDLDVPAPTDLAYPFSDGVGIFPTDNTEFAALQLDQVPSHAILYRWGDRVQDGETWGDVEAAAQDKLLVARWELGVPTNGRGYHFIWTDYGALNLCREGDTPLSGV